MEGLSGAIFEDVERLFYYLEMIETNPRGYQAHAKSLFDRGYDFIAPDGSLTAEQVDIVIACFQTRKGKAVFVDPKNK